MVAGEVLADDAGDRPGRRQLHLPGDRGRAGVDGAAEHTREGQHVVDLVGQSLRPVATTAAYRGAIPGSTSGVGSASENTMASAAMDAVAASGTVPPDTPRWTSAPSSAPVIVPA